MNREVVMNEQIKYFSIGLLVVMITGCASGPVVKYKDAKSPQLISADFSSSDLQQIVQSMVQSLLSAPAVVQLTNQHPPVILVDQVRNKSMQHVDTEAITDSIRTELIQSGKFRFIDRSTDEAALAEIKIQREGGLVDSLKAIQIGKQFGAEYLLTGSITEIQQSNDKVTDVYFKITLNLKNLTTGLLDWASEKEIRKTSTRRTFGG